MVGFPSPAPVDGAVSVTRRRRKETAGSWHDGRRPTEDVDARRPRPRTRAPGAGSRQGTAGAGFRRTASLSPGRQAERQVGPREEGPRGRFLFICSLSCLISASIWVITCYSASFLSLIQGGEKNTPEFLWGKETPTLQLFSATGGGSASELLRLLSPEQPAPSSPRGALWEPGLGPLGDAGPRPRPAGRWEPGQVPPQAEAKTPSGSTCSPRPRAHPA